MPIYGFLCFQILLCVNSWSLVHAMAFTHKEAPKHCLPDKTALCKTPSLARWDHLIICGSENWTSIDQTDMHRKAENKKRLPRKLNTRVVRRRSLIESALIPSVLSASLVLQPAQAFWLVRDRTQLELCLVTVLRTKYWAIELCESLENAFTVNDENKSKFLYLEARLGAKALLTQQIGGGASNRVYILAGLKLRECLNDGVAWYGDHVKLRPKSSINNLKSIRELQEVADEIIYVLGSIVEFDGLESTTDPSPRSSLMLRMYSKEKLIFIQRILSEQLLSNLDKYLSFFDSSAIQTCDEYVRANLSGNDYFSKSL